jgi:hypothetical protein
LMGSPEFGQLTLEVRRYIYETGQDV